MLFNVLYRSIISSTSYTSITIHIKQKGDCIMTKTPDGKYMGSVKVGSKGQIVIPKEVRDMFNIEPGETLILLADINQGVAIQKFEIYETFAKEIFRAKNNPKEAE